mmetsp:Transcript_39671/g.104725  ORF Transcript_39671/g.104725 Transcript_39671/m.104725 type:complete len:556 (+) Transcript_39671:3-1670(+)
MERGSQGPRWGRWRQSRNASLPASTSCDAQLVDQSISSELAAATASPAISMCEPCVEPVASEVEQQAGMPEQQSSAAEQQSAQPSPAEQPSSSPAVTAIAPPPSWRMWGVSILTNVLDHTGLSEPAGPLLDFLSGGTTAAVPGKERFSSSGNQCLICFDAVPTFATSACDHALCTTCAVSYVRGAVGDAQAQVHAAGVRCPMHSSGCMEFITSTDAARLLTARDSAKLAAESERGMPIPGTVDTSSAAARSWSRLIPQPLARWSERHLLNPLRAQLAARFGPPDQLHEQALSISEVHRLHRFSIEAAIPEAQRTWCPRCHLLVLLPESKDAEADRSESRLSRVRYACMRPLRWISARWRAPSAGAPWLVCPHCAHGWDPVRDAADPRAAAGDRAFDERASAVLIELTSKECPNPTCQQRITHWHGHACHHIAPSTGGCPACRQHFCYVCLRRHGPPGDGYQRHPHCRHGSSYCVNDSIVQNIVLSPYPYDRRCGCPICSLCQQGRPCAQCDGRCVVCLGLVQPGPSVLSAAALQEVEREANRRAGWWRRSSRRNS